MYIINQIESSIKPITSLLFFGLPRLRLDKQVWLELAVLPYGGLTSMFSRVFRGVADLGIKAFVGDGEIVLQLFFEVNGLFAEFSAEIKAMEGLIGIKEAFHFKEHSFDGSQVQAEFVGDVDEGVGATEEVPAFYPGEERRQAFGERRTAGVVKFVFAVEAAIAMVFRRIIREGDEAFKSG